MTLGAVTMGKLDSFVFKLVTANISPTSEAGYGALVGLDTLGEIHRTAMCGHHIVNLFSQIT